jgi:hypothetical protein
MGQPVRALRDADVLFAPDGGSVSVAGDALEFRDRAGNLLVRYEDGEVVVAPPSGDLRLVAPSGRVHIEGAVDVAIVAGRDIGLAAGRSVEAGLEPSPAQTDDDKRSRLRLDGRGAKLSGHSVELSSHRLRAVADVMDHVASRFRLVAHTVETRASDVSTVAELVKVEANELRQDIVGLFESRARRVRALVADSFSLTSKSTTMRSDEDTSIDGRRVLLG